MANTSTRLHSDDTGTAASTFQFTVTLSAAATQDATIQYATADGDAKQTTDYQSASGTVTIAAGKQSRDRSDPTDPTDLGVHT